MPQKLDNLLKSYSLIIIVAVGISGIYAARGLYADGSFFLFEMLDRNGFYIFDPHRAYVQTIVQAPIVFAIWLGVLDLNMLIRVHSLGLVTIPLIFWIGALVLQYKTKLFWFFLMALTVTYLRTNFFAAGEFSVAYGMTAFCASVLLRERISLLQAVLMTLTAIGLTHSYEATFFLGIFLVGVSIFRFINVKTDTTIVRTLILLSVIIFIFSIYIGGRSIFFQRAFSSDNISNLSALTDIHLMYLIVIPSLAFLLFICSSRRINSLLFILLISVIVLYLLYAFRWDNRNISYGFFSYGYRGLCCFLLIGVMFLATISRFLPKIAKSQSTASKGSLYLAIGSIIFFSSMAYMMLYHTYGYYRWAQRFEKEAIALKNHTPIDKTGINTNHGLNYGYNWMWGNPSASILLRGNAEAMILNNSNYKGIDPGFYENVKLNDPKSVIDQSTYESYPLFPYIKKELLFPYFSR